jgi:Rad3-related DNA helicase
MLDPRLKNIVLSHLSDDAIIVFDECHNIEKDCMNSLSMYLNRILIEQASTSLKQLEDTIREFKGSDKLQAEYNLLMHNN